LRWVGEGSWVDSKAIAANGVTNKKPWVSIPAVLKVPELRSCSSSCNQESGQGSRKCIVTSLRRVCDCTQPQQGQ
jgi:hypothetical protein